jgi:hypothetical protein
MPAEDEEFLNEQFEHELCSNCAGDTPDHIVADGPFGEPHAVCKSEI